MTRNCPRLLSILVMLILTIGAISPPMAAAAQDNGDDHWAGELTVAGFDSNVTSLVSDQQGNVYAGGDFTAFGGMPANHIARWDGKTWSALGDGLQEPAHNLVVDSRGNLYTDVLDFSVSGMPETIVMRWDGSAWSALGGNLSSLVDTLAKGRESNILITDLEVDSQDRLYAGGYFYLIQSDRYVGYVARWDGKDWSLLGSGMNHTVYQLAIDGQDSLYAAGEFTLAGGVPASRIAKWDGKNWKALGSGLGGTAPTVAVLEADAGGNLYVTGQFETAGGIPIQLIARWDGASWKDLAPGQNRGWFEGESATIFDLSVSKKGDLYAAGSFTAIYGVRANNIARWDGSTWKALGSTGSDGVNERVFAVTVNQKDQVFAGGFFTNAGGLPANHIARWDGSTWYTWMGESEDRINNQVRALAVDQDGVLYAGGYFTSAGSNPINHIARWDGKEWNALGEGVNAVVHAIALDHNGGLYAGGEFTEASGLAVNYIARWDGAAWSPLGEGMGSSQTIPQVNALVVDSQGHLYAGGSFTNVGGIEANYIARWDGSIWSPLGNGMDDQVTKLVIDPQGNLVAIGWFNRAGNVSTHGIARWDGSSWSGFSSGADMVEAIAIDPEGQLFAAGMFPNPPGSSPSAAYVAKWDGAQWRPLGSDPDNLVHLLAVDPEGNLYAAGDFTTAGDVPATHIARWDGTRWNPLGSGIGASGDYSAISALAVDDQGNLYVGGQFTLAGNKPSAYLAKWCAELEDGGCTLSFERETNVQAPTPLPSVPATQPVVTPAVTATEQQPQPSLTAVVGTPPAVAGARADSRILIGAGVLLGLLVAGLFFFFSRRAG